jgi:hypothetical protein
VEIAGERFLKNILDGFARREDRILRHVADAQPFADRARPGIGRVVAGDDLQQRRFPRSVRADQSDVIALVNREAEVLEKGTGRE